MGGFPLIGRQIAAMMGSRAAIALFPWIGPMIAHLANAYLTGAPAAPTAAELSALNSWIESEFNSLPCKVQFWTGDVTLAECRAAFNISGVLNISIANNSHPYLTKSANAKFRAIHDWAHIELGADDSFNGEWATWENNNAPDSIQWILFSEIVLQAAAAIHFGEFPGSMAAKLVKF
jgi:hypothetical protein